VKSRRTSLVIDPPDGREPFEQFKTTLRAISDNGLLVPPDAGDVPAASRRTHARRTPSRRAKR